MNKINTAGKKEQPSNKPVTNNKYFYLTFSTRVELLAKILDDLEIYFGDLGAILTRHYHYYAWGKYVMCSVRPFYCAVLFQTRIVKFNMEFYDVFLGWR